MLGLLVFGYFAYQKIFAPNTKFSEKEVFVYIPSDSDYLEVEKIVSPYVENMENFRSVAEKKSYVANVKAGKFLLKKRMNTNDLINSLRQPLETKIAFNNQERLEDFAGRISTQIDICSIKRANNGSTDHAIGVTCQNLPCKCMTTVF
mgnify:CR=1 FL=1